MARRKRSIATQSSHLKRIAFYLVDASNHPPKSFTQYQHDKLAANLAVINPGWIAQVNQLLSVPING